MRNKILLFGLSLFIVSCSSDDSSEPTASLTDFLPLTDGNNWTYDVTTNTPEGGNGTDYLYIANDTVINGTTYKKFKTENLALGFYSNSLANNGVRKSDDQLLLTGAAAINFAEELPFAIEVNDFVIFKENATNNETLGSLTGSFQEEIEGYNVVFQYGLTSVAKADLATYTTDVATYANVKPIEIKLSLNAVVEVEFLGTTIPVTIMPQQDVVVSMQYYAENIGVVHVITDLGYELADLSQYPIEIPIPESVAIQQQEVLINYTAE
ncbi:hypothetical protein [Flavobacterium litorale]|uniref:Uncharacterized protein n=1 Tax=Flavobacterium litorale TaxID=2856519 RepID=A0ABX8V4W4_9FLAO|nr:hypothetical protein [Flavobacterium litorale]QYJ67875.1 hypothetical protein K1I41_10030 [Flavobacterium litorale]